ncbi:phosphatidylethanolamine-binding protein [Formosimonas limnophila]|uniref:Phosphatidylethanolamine-binding protein n=1 Tax=Formosimonas limnophila TaxID=1384487 RepID=A0A8J3CIP7_9BURK|nr:YbhB/YbcL family Raf kinase inhibitor-like protein [Formosimonas limnophila]GHA78933.1 phosphatidylethanolamine-binding protein [Formosimonas limnophila]
MKLYSDSFPNQGVIPAEFAFAVIDEKTRVKLSSNKNPHLAWSEAPADTQSFAILCVDADAPTDATDVNQTDREVPADLPRTDFSHWVLINIPAHINEITAGQFSHEVTPKGKAGPVIAGQKDSLMRHGINDYTHWFAGDHDMEGDYYGYDGPCPPWNDSVVHRYTFTVYALDTLELALPTDGKLNIASVQRRMADHVLDSASWTGVYTLTPRLAAALAI